MGVLTQHTAAIFETVTRENIGAHEADCGQNSKFPTNGVHRFASALPPRPVYPSVRADQSCYKDGTITCSKK